MLARWEVGLGGVRGECVGRARGVRGACAGPVLEVGVGSVCGVCVGRAWGVHGRVCGNKCWYRLLRFIIRIPW